MTFQKQMKIWSESISVIVQIKRRKMADAANQPIEHRKVLSDY